MSDSLPDASEDTFESKYNVVLRILAVKVWHEYFGTKTHGCCYTCCKYIKFIDQHRTWCTSYVVSISDGGTAVLSNLRVLCLDCHMNKDKANLYDFMKKNSLTGMKGAAHRDNYLTQHPEYETKQVTISPISSPVSSVVGNIQGVMEGTITPGKSEVKSEWKNDDSTLIDIFCLMNLSTVISFEKGT